MWTRLAVGVATRLTILTKNQSDGKYLIPSHCSYITCECTSRASCQDEARLVTVRLWIHTVKTYKEHLTKSSAAWYEKQHPDIHLGFLSPIEPRHLSLSRCWRLWQVDTRGLQLIWLCDFGFQVLKISCCQAFSMCLKQNPWVAAYFAGLDIGADDAGSSE